jgi:hypothetical protein
MKLVTLSIHIQFLERYKVQGRKIPKYEKGG